MARMLIDAMLKRRTENQDRRPVNRPDLERRMADEARRLIDDIMSGTSIETPQDVEDVKADIAERMMLRARELGLSDEDAMRTVAKALSLQ